MSRNEVRELISIHAPTWGATYPTTNDRDADPVFQSTHPRGVRLHDVRPPAARDYFNPRTHVGCDLASSVALIISSRFQSTHPRGVRPPPCVRMPSSPPNFNPRTHVGCDPLHASVGAGHRISIHAPTWGATANRAYIGKRRYISIHAPTWGATALQDRVQQDFIDFNPRTHVGCDAVAALQSLIDILFQSTHPRGVRRVAANASDITELKISIHAPTWGATGLMGRGLDSAKISIHAPTWGATWSSAWS